MRYLDEHKKQVIVKARVQRGGEGEQGVVATFITLDNNRFTYQMPSVDTAKTAVMMLAVKYPEQFPISLTSESATRAVFKRQ
jgi:hypothetical protein